MDRTSNIEKTFISPFYTESDSTQATFHSLEKSLYSVWEKVKIVATYVFATIIYSSLYYFTPNLCYLGVLIGLCFGERIKLKELINTVVRIWSRLEEHQAALLVPFAFFPLPFTYVTLSVTAYACLADHLSLIAHGKPGYSFSQPKVYFHRFLSKYMH